MNSRYRFKHWLKALVATFTTAVVGIAILLNLPQPPAQGLSSVAAEGAKLFMGQGCAACHQTGSALLAPQLAGIFGSIQTLTDGSQIRAENPTYGNRLPFPKPRSSRATLPPCPSTAT
jgi:mono/diheme cytochrome c family protein